MKGLLQSSVISVFLIILTACGGGGGSSDDSPSSNQSVTASGAASKGIFINGLVTAYPLINGIPDLSNALGSDTTDSTGQYSIDLSDADTTNPILIRVTAGAETLLMKCDIPAGCGTGIAFGDNYPIDDSDFYLDAIVTAIGNNSVSVNPTPLTHLATSLALESITNSNSTVEEAINNANSQIADLFGITGNLTGFETLDITDIDAVAATDEATIEYATLNAAIIAAILTDDNALSIEGALNKFVNDFNANTGIASNTSEDAETGLDEIFAAAQAVLVSIESIDSNNTVDLTALNIKLAANEQTANNELPDQYNNGTPSETANASELAQAKQLVADLRDLNTVIAGTTVNGGLTVEEITDNFSAQLEAANLVSSDDFRDVNLAIQQAVTAMTEAGEVLADEPTLTEYTAFNFVTVTIARSNDNVIYTVNEDVDGVSINLGITVPDADSIDNQIVISINGTAAKDTILMTIADGSEFSVTAASVSTVANFQLDLDVIVNQQNTGNPISFTGGLGIAFTADEEALQSITDNSSSDTSSSANGTSANGEPLPSDGINGADGGDGESGIALSLTDVVFTISGSFSNSNGESFNASIALAATDTQTAEGFSNITLAFDAELGGIADTVSFELSWDDPALESTSATMTITYPGHQLVFNASSSSALEISNQDGVVIDITSSNDVITGTISVNDIVYANISGDPSLIRYIDGILESF
ncbi:MAG: hypothetical protein ACRBCI_13520 [Cellvibrionaceae bacterium]